MIIGHTLVAISTDATTVYTPWVSAWGDEAIFTYEVIDISASTTLTVKAYTKNSEQVDSAQSTVGSASTKTTAGIGSISNSPGVKELVRLEFELTGTGSVSTVHFRPLSPSWLSN